MLKKRVIPTLLILGGRLVKGKGFKDFRDTGNPRTTMRGFSAQHSDEIMLINLSPNKTYLALQIYFFYFLPTAGPMHEL